jgi:DNA replication protein DnaC
MREANTIINRGSEYVMMCGKHIHPSFNLDNDRYVQYKKIYLYLFNPELAEEYNIDSKKGLYLYGESRSGKTTMMRTVQMMIALADSKSFKTRRFPIIEMDNLKRDFRQEGDKIFAEHEFDKSDYGFDEMFRNESSLQQKYSSEKINLDIEIIFERSRLFHSKDLRTYITSNATLEMIERSHTVKVSKRIQEMCNIIFI